MTKTTMAGYSKSGRGDILSNHENPPNGSSCWPALLVAGWRNLSVEAPNGTAKVFNSCRVAPSYFFCKPFGGSSLKGFFICGQVLTSRWRTVQINRSGLQVFFGSLMYSSD